MAVFCFAGVSESLQKVGAAQRREIFFDFLGDSRGMLLRNILKMEPLKLAENAFSPGRGVEGGFLYGKMVGVLVIFFRV